jgi:choline dehydrogenase-like flavoprotein
MLTEQSKFDIIIIGAGVSGPFLAQQFCDQGLKVLMLEAGESLDKDTYPTKEIDSNSRLYWGGGIELNTRADIALLRPKVVGGGSLVNQALLDRFDDIALDSWKETSQIDYFNRELMDPWYEKAEAELSFQEIPEAQRTENALIFKQGFENNGYDWAPLTRAQKDCHYEDGNDCIECLSGCRIDSKQSSAITVLRRTKKEGLTLVSRFEVNTVKERNGIVTVDYGIAAEYFYGLSLWLAGRGFSRSN